MLIGTFKRTSQAQRSGEYASRIVETMELIDGGSVVTASDSVHEGSI